VAEQKVPQLGQLITEDGWYRDAVHIAVVPVTAAESLVAGEHIGLAMNSKSRVSADVSPHIGIVDPFLDKDRVIRTGDRFWMFLYPNTITSLRHVWTHPAFAATVPETKEDRKS
jgi:hypothetical protein